MLGSERVKTETGHSVLTSHSLGSVRVQILGWGFNSADSGERREQMSGLANTECPRVSATLTDQSQLPVEETGREAERKGVPD